MAGAAVLWSVTGSVLSLAFAALGPLGPGDAPDPRVRIWLPPGYEDSRRSYRTLYMLDGQFVFAGDNQSSVYCFAADAKGYVAERYVGRLGRAKIGKSCVMFRKLENLDEESVEREEVTLGGRSAQASVAAFLKGDADLVLGGTFSDLPYARVEQVPRNALRFDPAAGLFGLVPARADGPAADLELRRLLSQAIDRQALIDALNVPGLDTVIIYDARYGNKVDRGRMKKLIHTIRGSGYMLKAD